MPYLATSSKPSVDLFYQDLGTGRPVVLIHGWPLSHRMWESQINALLEAGFRVVAYDRRGFGSSDQPAGGYDYDTFAADLRDLILGLDLRDVTLAGFSMGGGEVARYFGRYGADRVSRAMLIGAVPPFLLKTPDNPDGAAPKSLFDDMIAAIRRDRIGFFEGFFPKFYGVDKRPGAVPEATLRYLGAIAWSASPIATQQCVTAFGTTDFRGDLAKVTVPTLVIHGDDDVIVPIEASGKRSAQLIKGSRLEVIEGGPHGLAATHADELSRLMVEFARG